MWKTAGKEHQYHTSPHHTHIHRTLWGVCPSGPLSPRPHTSLFPQNTPRSPAPLPSLCAIPPRHLRPCPHPPPHPPAVLVPPPRSLPNINHPEPGPPPSLCGETIRPPPPPPPSSSALDDLSISPLYLRLSYLSSSSCPPLLASSLPLKMITPQSLFTLFGMLSSTSRHPLSTLLWLFSLSLSLSLSF